MRPNLGRQCPLGYESSGRDDGADQGMAGRVRPGRPPFVQLLAHGFFALHQAVVPHQPREHERLAMGAHPADHVAIQGQLGRRSSLGGAVAVSCASTCSNCSTAMVRSTRRNVASLGRRVTSSRAVKVVRCSRTHWPIPRPCRSPLNTAAAISVSRNSQRSRCPRFCRGSGIVANVVASPPSIVALPGCVAPQPDCRRWAPSSPPLPDFDITLVG